MSSEGCEGGNNVEERRRVLLKKTDELIEEIRETRASEENKVMIRLMVGDSRRRDVGRGIARIDQKTMQELGVSAGGVIEIVGKRTTSAIAWPAYSEDQNREIIRIDGFTRKNAGVAINEYVVVRPAKVKNALGVTLAPVDMRLNVDQDFTNFVRNRLMERTFIEGDTTLVIMLGHTMPFTIENTDPDGIVKVTAETRLTILNEPGETLRELRRREKEKKKWQRFAWLKAMERKCGSDHVKFCIPEWNIETDKEDDVLSKAEDIMKNKNKPVIIFIQLWEKRGKIGSLKWAKLNLDGTHEYIYPENLLKTCPICGEPLASYHGRYYCYKCSRYV